MAVPFTRLQSEALDSYGSKEAFDNLAKHNGIVAILGSRGAIKFETGGQPNFRERTLYGENTNVAYRGKNAQIPTSDDEGYTMASVPQRVLDGTIVYNQVELDQVAGNPAIAPSVIRDKIDQFNSTWVQKFGDAVLQATPGTNDPYTILPSGTTGTINGLLVARTTTQQGTDGGTTAGIPRSYAWWRNQYSNTSADLTATAGRRTLFNEVYLKCVRGGSKAWQPDFGLCAGVVLASLGAAADANRRATYEDTSVMKLGFDNIMFYNAALVYDASTRLINGSAGKVAFLSTRCLKLKVLRGQGKVTKEMLDQRNNLKSIPIFWKNKKQAESDYDSLNWCIVGYSVHSIVPKSLQDIGLHDNCT